MCTSKIVIADAVSVRYNKNSQKIEHFEVLKYTCGSVLQ